MSAGKDRDRRGRREEPEEDDRSRPFDPTSEQVVLAAYLRGGDPGLLRRVGPDDCYGERHRIAWAVLREMEAEGLAYDPPTFARAAAGLGFSEREWGGDGYLRDLVEAYPDGDNLEWHLGQARAEARLRALADGPAEEALSEMRRPGALPSRVVALCREVLSAAGAAASASDGRTPAAEGAEVGDRYRERFAARLAGKVDNVPVGLAELDAALTWGWHPGHVTVLCGRPSCGKSSFAYNVAKWWVDACDRGRHPDPRPLLFCPLEMGNEAAQDALVARAAGLDVTRLVKDARGLSLAEQASVASAVDRYAAGPWTAWFDEPGASLERVEEVLSAASVPDGRGGARSRYGLVVVDLFDKTLPDLRPETITSALNRAQAAARTHGTHLLLLAQIRRGVEKRGDKRPTREDLKGSGGFEEVADQILCVHRERVYDPDLEDDTMEVGVLKQRLGPFGQWLTYAYDAPRFAVGAFRESSQE